MDLPIHQREIDAAEAVVDDLGQSEKLTLTRGSGRDHLALCSRPLEAFRLGFRVLRPDDRRDQRPHIGLRGLERANVGAVAQHGDAMRDAEHLVEAMGHIDDADVLPDDRVNGVEQDLLFVAAQRRGRLVQDKHAHPAHQRFADLGHLPVGEWQRADRCARIERDVVLLEKVLGLRHQLSLLEKAETARGLPVQHQVGADGQRLDQAEVLVDHGDSRLARFRGAVEGDRRAVDLDRAALEAVHAAENLDQRRLAGAVLAEKRMDLAARTSKLTPRSA